MSSLLHPTKIARKKRSSTRGSLYSQLSSLGINKIIYRSNMDLTTNSSADSNGNCLQLLSLVNKDVDSFTGELQEESPAHLSLPN